MTNQSSEDLVNEHASFRPGEWRVYAVIRGEPTKDNHGWGTRGPDGGMLPVYGANPGNPSAASTANHKGFTERWRLAADGSLTLLRFDYDLDQLPTRVVNERIEGDFYVVLKALFNGPRVYVPFRDGRLVLEPTPWRHEIYVGNSPVATELRPGPHPDYPGTPRLWYE